MNNIVFSGLKHLWSGWKKFAHAWGRVNSVIILTVLYLVVFGAYAVVVFCLRKLRRGNVAPKAFWREKKYTPPSVEIMERQF